MSNKVMNYKITFEAIHSVRMELANAAKVNNVVAANDCLNRLAELYASIDAKGFIDTMNELESLENVIKVDFKKAA